MNKKGMTATEAILIVFIFICFAGAAWYGISKKSEVDKFASGSKQVNIYHQYVTRKYALLDLVISPFNWRGCGLVKDDQEPIENITNEDVAETNSIVNTNKQ